MPGFRRAQLRGSEELFRSTTHSATLQGDEPAQDDLLGMPDVVHPAPATGDGHPEGRLVRLTDEEIHLLADALQRLKYPQKVGSKPPVDEYERLEDLRQKLLRS